MSTHSDPKEQEPSSKAIIDAATNSRNAVNLLLEKLLKPQFEYDIKQKSVNTGELLDVLAFVQELGAEGWELIEMPKVGKIPTGMVDDQQRPLLKLVCEAFVKRRK